MRHFLISASALALTAFLPSAAQADCFDKLDAARADFDQIDMEQIPEELSQRFTVDYELAADLAETNSALCEAIANRLEAVTAIAGSAPAAGSIASRAQRVTKDIAAKSMAATSRITAAEIDAGQAPGEELQRRHAEMLEELKRMSEAAMANRPQQQMQAHMKRLKEGALTFNGVMRSAAAGVANSKNGVQSAADRFSKSLDSIDQLETALASGDPGNSPDQAESHERQHAAHDPYRDALPSEYLRKEAILERQWQQANEEVRKICDAGYAAWEVSYVTTMGRKPKDFGDFAQMCAAKYKAVNEEFDRKNQALRDEYAAQIDHARRLSEAGNGQIKPGMEELAAKKMAEYEARKKKGAKVIEVAETKAPATSKSPAKRMTSDQQRQAQSLIDRALQHEKSPPSPPYIKDGNLTEAGRIMEEKGLVLVQRDDMQRYINIALERRAQIASGSPEYGPQEQFFTSDNKPTSTGSTLYREGYAIAHPDINEIPLSPAIAQKTPAPAAEEEDDLLAPPLPPLPGPAGSPSEVEKVVDKEGDLTPQYREEVYGEEYPAEVPKRPNDPKKGSPN